MAFLYFGMHNHWAYMINLVRYVVYYVWFTISKLCRLGGNMWTLGVYMDNKNPCGRGFRLKYLWWQRGSVYVCEMLIYFF